MHREIPNPFFEVPGPAPRRLLLVSYCFPPDTTVGARRWQKLSRFANERGWGLDVITLDPLGVKRADASGLEGLPAGTRVFGVPAPQLFMRKLENTIWGSYRRLRPSRAPASNRPSAVEASATGSIPTPSRRPNTLAKDEIRWIPGSARDLARSYFAVMDLAYYRRWSRDAARLGRLLAAHTRYDAVITSGPPHATHEAGRLIARTTRLPFIVDLRDPWSCTRRIPESIASPLAVMSARRQERGIVRGAALIVPNTSALLLEMSRLYPDASKRMIAVRNGADDDPVPTTRHGKSFVIAFGGTVYYDRDPRMLLRGVASVARELGLGPADLRVEFIGAFEGAGAVPIRAIAAEEGVAEFVHVGPPRSHREAMEFYAGAALLVTFPGYNADLTIPAKLFEYVRFDAWILALAEPGSPTDELLEGCDAEIAAPADADGIGTAIRRRYLLYVAGTRPKALASDRRFDRRGQADLLFDAMAACIDHGRRGEQRP